MTADAKYIIQALRALITIRTSAARYHTETRTEQLLDGVPNGRRPPNGQLKNARKQPRQPANPCAILLGDAKKTKSNLYPKLQRTFARIAATRCNTALSLATESRAKPSQNWRHQAARQAATELTWTCEQHTPPNYWN